MPLKAGKSQKVISSNIAEFHGGKTYNATRAKFGKKKADAQAVAVAMANARKYADGGLVEDRDKIAHDILDWFRKPKPPEIEPSEKVETKAPIDKSWPSAVDADFSAKMGNPYADPVESYTKAGMQNVREVTPDAVLAWNKAPVSGGIPRTINHEDANRIHRQWLAAQRSPVGKLGFSQRNMIETPDASLTVAGLYDPRTNESWYDTNYESSAVHESLHRGIEMLRKAGKLPSDLPREEYIIRALMARHFGDVELGRGSFGDAQILAARKIVKDKDLDFIEKAASDYLALKRPRGPR